MLLQLLLFTATAGSAAALAPYTRRFVAGRTRDSAAKPPRRRRVTCRVLDDEAIGLDLEALQSSGRVHDIFLMHDDDESEVRPAHAPDT